MYEKKFKITKYTSEIVEVSKSQYQSHLLQKLNRADELVQDIRIKKMKLESKLEDAIIDKNKIISELEELDGSELTSKHLEYLEWRFKEMYPKKYELLKGL